MKDLIASEVGVDEELGRSVHSSKVARRALRMKTDANIFRPRLGNRRVSVDRISIAPSENILQLAIERGKSRGSGFYGWAIIARDKVLEIGCTVEATPVSGNPYHADIIFPKEAENDQFESARYAKRLARASRWRAID